MRTLYFTLILALTTIALQAQEPESPAAKKYRHEIGIDVTKLFKSLIFVDNSSFSEEYILLDSYSSPYAISYSFNFNKIGIRLGYGQNISNLKLTGEKHSSNSTSTQHEDDAQEYSLYYLRLGMQVNNDLGKHWQYYYGLDATGASISYFLQNNGEQTNGIVTYATTDETTLDGLMYGGGPFVGIKLKLSDRISLSTEASLYFLYTDAKETSKSVSQPSYPNSTQVITTSKDDITGTQMKFNAPISVFLNIKF